MATATRPKIELEWSPLDRTLEGLGAAAALLLLVLPAAYYGDLPEQIPTHFNTLGEPDGYGTRATIWLLPLIGIILYLFLTMLNRFPHQFNYLVTITSQNAEQQYTAATRLIRWLKTGILLLFAFITWKVISGAMEGNSRLGAGFLLVLFLSTGLPIIWYCWKAFSVK